MGFFEILMVAVVTLLVVGPERMPEAVRNVALTIGRIKRAIQNTKSEIEEHIGADDIRQQLNNEAIMARLDAENEAIKSVVKTDKPLNNNQEPEDTKDSR